MNYFAVAIFVVATNLRFACGQSDYEMRRTENGSSTSFDLPEEELVFIAFRADHDEEFNFSFKLFVDETYVGGVDLYYPKHNDWLFIQITRKRISYIPIKTVSTIREDYQKLQGRRVTVSSQSPIRWQLLFPPEPRSDENNLQLWLIILGVTCSILAIVSVSLAICLLKEKKKKKKASTAQQKDPNATEMNVFQSSVQDGNVNEMNTQGDVHPRVQRPGSSHDSENSLYGAIIR